MQARRALIKDAPVIAAFNQAMALETEGKNLATDIVNNGVQYCINHPDNGFYLVVEDNGIIAGCLGITFEWSDWRNGLFWWIQSVYVEPGHRRQGVFSLLYSEVKAQAKRDSQVCGIRLYVEKDNLDAQKTYAALGMLETDYRILEETFKPNGQ